MNNNQNNQSNSSNQITNNPPNLSNINNQLTQEMIISYTLAQLLESNPSQSQEYQSNLRLNQFSIFQNLTSRNLSDLVYYLQGTSRQEQSSSPRQKNTNLEKYMQKRTNEIHNEQLDKDDPHIKVTVVKNMNYSNSNNQHEYFINQYGLIGSQKNANTEDILIGRVHRADIIPIDIMLPEDRIISRIHCKIVCKDFFKQESTIQPKYKRTILLMNNRLPNNAIRIISKFLEEPKNVYVQDLASGCGTQLKVIRLTPTIMVYDQKFGIGSETTFFNLFCKSYTPQGKPVDDSFFQLLKKFSNYQKHQNNKFEIHFSDQEYFQNLQNTLLDTQKEEYLDMRDYFEQFNNYRIPVIIIKFQGQGIDISKSQNIFIGYDENINSPEFLIGRGQDSNIKINSNTISRKQCRFNYLERLHNWVIMDGGRDRDSANGTWLSLSTVDQSEKKQESNLIAIKNNAELKISDFTLKIELCPGKQSYKLIKKLTQELISS